MAKLFVYFSKTLKPIICLLLLATTLASSARILDDVTPQTPLATDAPGASDPTVAPDTTNPNEAPVVAPDTTLPSGQLPTADTASIIPTEPVAPIVAPVADTSNTATPITPVVPPVTDIPIADAPSVATNVPPVTTPTTTTSGGAATASIANGDHPTLSFFMHDILGGSHPSGRVVAGIVANTDANNLPFSKPNNRIFPINGGVPLNTVNGVINNNNYPFLVGLNGSPSNTLVQSNGNNVVADNNNQAFVTAGQLPAGITVQQLMFGSVTVVDNEITEGHELGTSVLGRAQGFYLTSSSDGSSHTLVLTTLFHNGDHEIFDTISFFGIHRTATPVSHIAIVGGTGKYENAKGYATIETLPQVDQHTTDGVETITHFTVYLTP